MVVTNHRVFGKLKRLMDRTNESTASEEPMRSEELLYTVFLALMIMFRPFLITMRATFPAR